MYPFPVVHVSTDKEALLHKSHHNIMNWVGMYIAEYIHSANATLWLGSLLWLRPLGFAGQLRNGDSIKERLVWRCRRRMENVLESLKFLVFMELNVCILRSFGGPRCALESRKVNVVIMWPSTGGFW